jgi:hypothetical protein
MKSQLLRQKVAYAVDSSADELVKKVESKISAGQTSLETIASELNAEKAEAVGTRIVEQLEGHGELGREVRDAEIFHAEEAVAVELGAAGGHGFKAPVQIFFCTERKRTHNEQHYGEVTHGANNRNNHFKPPFDVVNYAFSDNVWL